MSSEQKGQRRPSLQLAYEYVRDILLEQGRIAQSRDSKAAVLWAVATAVIGVGIPLGINEKIAGLDFNLYAMIAVLVLYILITIAAIVALFPRRIETMKHPEGLYDRYAVLPKEYFIEYIYQDIEQGFKENDKIIKLKGWSTFALFILTFAETLTLVGWFVYAVQRLT